MISLKYRKSAVILGLVLIFVMCYFIRRKSVPIPHNSSVKLVKYNELLKKLKMNKQDVSRHTPELKELMKLALFKVESRDGIRSGLCPISHVRIGEFCFPEYEEEDATEK